MFTFVTSIGIAVHNIITNIIIVIIIIIIIIIIICISYRNADQSSA